MLIGMVAQIFLGPMTGFAPVYELHLLFRCAAAATCSMMCIGIMIGRIEFTLPAKTLRSKESLQFQI